MVAAADGAGAAAADDARPSFKRPTLTKGRVLSLQQPGHRYASFVGDDAALKKDWASLSDEQKEGLLDKIGVYTVADLGSLAWLKKVAGVLGKSEPDLAGHLDENTRTNEARYFDVLEWLGGGVKVATAMKSASWRSGPGRPAAAATTGSSASSGAGASSEPAGFGSVNIGASWKITQEESLETESTAKSARFLTKLRKINADEGNPPGKRSRVDLDKTRSLAAVSHKAYKLKSEQGVAIVEELASLLSSKNHQASATLVVSFFGDAGHTSQTADLAQQTGTSLNPVQQTLRFTGGCKQTKKSPRSQGKEHLNASSVEYNSKNSEGKRTAYIGIRPIARGSFRPIARGSSTATVPLHGLVPPASPSTPAPTSAASHATAPAAPDSRA